MNEELNSMIQSVVEGLGCQLWGVEYLSLGKHSTLKIYIDAEKGVDIEDCTRVSRQVSSLLDVEDPIGGEYTLEVSSPGLDRKLFNLAQFEAFTGHQVKLLLRRPFEGKRKFSGQIRGVEGDEVILGQQEDEEILIPFGEIDRANIVPEV